jgi:hypothetical protein
MANRVSAPIIPGSPNVPFRPINPFGRKPQVLKADGTPLDWTSPLAEPLFQVWVLDHKKGTIPIFPKVGRAVAEEFLAHTKAAIKSGRIRGWAAPTILPAPPEKAVSRLF